MAVSNPTALTTITDGSTAKTVYTTGSVSPASDCLLIASLTTDPETAPYNVVPTVTTGLSNVGTWAWYEKDFGDVGFLQDTTLIGVAQVTGAPGSGTVTFTFGTQRDNCIVDLSYVTGHDTVTPVARSIGAAGAGTTASATFGATPASTSLVYVVSSLLINPGLSTEPITPRGTAPAFTEHSDLNSQNATYGFSNQQEVQYLNGSATTSISSTWTNSRDWAILGIEISQAGAAAYVPQRIVVSRQAVQRAGSW